MRPLCAVVPAFNAGLSIATTLGSLLPLDDILETIVVSDDGSTDDTVRVAEQWGFRHGVTVIVTTGSNAGPGTARNRGLAAARADWVLFIDADDQVLPDGVRRLFAQTSNDTSAVIGGRLEVGPDGSVRQVVPGSSRVHDIDIATLVARFLRRRGPSIQLASILARRNRLVQPAFPDARVGEDIGFIAALLSRGLCRFVDVPTVRYQADPERQLRREATFPDDLLSAVRFPFVSDGASPFLTPKMCRQAEAAAHLTLVRALSKCGDPHAARRHWRLAFELDASEALRWVYVKRLLGRPTRARRIADC